ncbi:FAD dependent oxidoreductase [Artomyces pyxidatus]|uniref:FAD dependent oxidoreductase n=1 Tax=Artomyces pyxidatus TaxID=48021 RepID=A0ACB8T2V6_9AGAM|nr:FAD dependent oxidoreductase [Artomyces pyxidatus]
MGSIASRLKIAYHILAEADADFRTVEARLQQSPGIPVTDSTTPYWTVPPATIAKRVDPLPEHADVVIIGSGITGAACARALLAHSSHETPLSVLMLEARDTCSGATGRNGGHINPPLFHDYTELKQEHGADIAQKIIRFRLAHLGELRSVAEEEGTSEHSQIRDVESFDVYYSPETYQSEKEALERWRADMPDEARDVHAIDGEEAVKRYRLALSTVGVIITPAGAAHPYRLVTTILTNLLARNADTFHLCTQTPCTDITAPTPSAPYYTLHTPHGPVTAAHVIHATNGWAPHLLPGLRTKILPVRGHMSAQRPGRALGPSTAAGARSHIFYNGPMGYDYLTQLPGPGAELMFGGGAARAGRIILDEVGVTDDGGWNRAIASHVGGALPEYFGRENWGREGGDDEGENGEWAEGRVKALWTGVLGISADGVPWVGRVPTKISGRVVPPAKTGVQPGEWIAAGYSGEGMVNAWMSGRALAYMVLGIEEAMHVPEWLPSAFLVSEPRWRKATLERFAERF